MATTKSPERKLFFNATTHLLILALFFFGQIALIATFSVFLQNISGYLMFFLYFLALCFCLFISTAHDNPSTKVFWIVLTAIFPAFGILLYLMWGLHRHGKRRHGLEYQSHIDSETALYAHSDAADRQEEEQSEAFQKHASIRLISNYLTNQDFPVYARTGMTYFASGETLFDDCIEEMSKAKRYIFISFFIFREGQLWDRVYEVLLRKVAEGVEVRMLVDGAGTLFSLDRDLIHKYRSEGIHIRWFNPTYKYINNLYLNYRNHQKIIVIDSNIGYTGGVNLADEYANLTSPLGYWKDTGVKLRGRAVFGLTNIFINMWDQTVKKLSKSYAQYYPDDIPQTHGFCHVFDDGPYNNPKNPAEGVICRMIETASETLFISTPYLAVSLDFIDTLCRVSKSGVRVVIVVPCQLDHWYVFEVTRSFFRRLLDAGVEVYRYSPGMIHSKMIIVDRAHAIVSSVNLDNRSFYTQYECGVWFFDSPEIERMAEDFDEIISHSYAVTVEEIRAEGLIRNSLGHLMRIFSPLM